jgi:AcrR family transcriptional regulator
MPDARSRVLRAAARCFADKGYAGTTIADIEAAAGLTVGAGGTYRHFRSKRAILEAVIDATVAVPDDEVAPPGDDIEAIAHEMLDYMRPQLIKIFLRDLDDFPEHRRRINDRMINTSYRVVAAKIAAANPDVDAEAAAAVLLGSLHNFRFNEVLIGPEANGVDRKRFIATWGAMYRELLSPRDPGRTDRATSDPDRGRRPRP